MDISASKFNQRLTHEYLKKEPFNEQIPNIPKIDSNSAKKQRSMINSGTNEEMLTEVPNEKENNNFVEFHSDKEINLNDLDMILLFLENPKSGGGEIISHQIDPKTPKVITINFKRPIDKKRALAKNNINFKSFNFRVCLPIDESSYKPNNQVIILKNFNEDEDISVVQMLAENLVMIEDETNDVTSIEKSQIFAKTFYIKFNKDFNLDFVKKRFEKYSNFKGNSIKLIPAFSTRIIIVRTTDTQTPLNGELIDIYFNNKKRSGISSFKSFYEKDPFILIELDCDDDIDSVLSRKHAISRNDLIVERLYNINMVNEVDNEQKCPERERNVAAMIESMAFKEESSANSESQSENSKMTTPQQEPTFKLTRLSFILDLKNFPNSKVLNFFNGIYLNTLESQLSSLNASLKRINDFEVRVDYMNQLPESLNQEEFAKFQSEWQDKVKASVSEFFDGFESKIVKINSPEILASLKIENWNAVINKVSDFEDSFEVFGLKSSVDSIVTAIETINHNQAKIESEIVCDQISELKLYEIRILFVNKFRNVIKEAFNDVVVNIVAKDGVVKIQGTKHQINHVKRKACEMLASIVKKEIPANLAMIKFVTKKENLMATWLRSNSIACVIEADPHRKVIVVYSTDNNEINNCISKMREEIICKEFETRIFEEEDIASDFMLSVESEPDIVCLLDKTVLYICGINRRVEQFYDVLKKMSY